MNRVTYVDAPCKSVLNRVNGKGLPFNWSINPYTGCSHACTYCYARRFYTQAERGSAAEFDSLIYVKSNAPEVLRIELARRSWKREMVVVGAATDPYQPAEAKFKVTRGILEALRDARTPVSIITKGPLVLRDIDLLREIRDAAGLEVNMTVPTMDAGVSRTLEPHTPPPAARMAAVRKLNDAGIRTGVFMAPILPGIADDDVAIRAVMEAAAAAGAPYCMPVTLRLQPGVREWFLPYISRHFPVRRATTPGSTRRSRRPGRTSRRPSAWRCRFWRSWGSTACPARCSRGPRARRLRLKSPGSCD